MGTDLKNAAIALIIFYGVIYIAPILLKVLGALLVVGMQSLINKIKTLILLDKVLIIGFLTLVCIAVSGCSTAKHVPTWRDAYLNRKPVIVAHGVPFYPEHLEYLNRNVEYMCLAGIKPMLPPEFSNKQAIDFCGCMSDEYYTKQEMMAILLKLDYNPNNVVLVFKQIQEEYWAVMDDEFKSNYREIVKYPPGYYEKITASRAKCIDDVNYKEYTKQVVNRE